LQEVVERLVEVYQPERIYLFGSRARGEAGPDSDYDILVVVPDNASRERHRSDAGYLALWSTGAPAEIMVWTHSAFQSRADMVASLPATVTREGRILYAA